MSTPAIQHKRFIEQAGWTQESRNLFLQTAKFQANSRILEVGCGTGAILNSIHSQALAQLFGIDIDDNMTVFARQQAPGAFISTADAYGLPFPNNTFHAVICHYLMLWIKYPEIILSEFMRITAPGGFIALLAEPDYSHRIDYPRDLEYFGNKQREALIQQGANPDIGLRIGELLGNAGCLNIQNGILGAFNSTTNEVNPSNEAKMMKSDISEMVTEERLLEYQQIIVASAGNNSLVQFIPTFFGWGLKP